MSLKYRQITFSDIRPGKIKTRCDAFLICWQPYLEDPQL
ncbi:unnamed protein product, partial [Allacma fusca]